MTSVYFADCSSDCVRQFAKYQVASSYTTHHIKAVHVCQNFVLVPLSAFFFPVYISTPT